MLFLNIPVKTMQPKVVSVSERKYLNTLFMSLSFSIFVVVFLGAAVMAAFFFSTIA